MASTPAPAETILIVDDEQSVRKTFHDWLAEANLDCRIMEAEDSAAALVLANHNAIDLAILDWNLGAGNDGLQLLEDLYLFNPDIVAIMITGYAHQATPLDAMRMGVRDYLDKNQDLTRETFLAAITKQLTRIRPARRQRLLHQSLVAFREAVEKVLPLVRSAAALRDPLPLPDAIRGLFQFLIYTTGAADGVLFYRRFDPAADPPELCRAFTAAGVPLSEDLVPFAHSVAGSIASMQQPSSMTGLDQLAASGTVQLQPFERNRRSLLAAPVVVPPDTLLVLELFDKKGAGALANGGFTSEDQQLVGMTAKLAADLLGHSIAEKQSYQLLFDAMAAAMDASESMAQTLKDGSAKRSEDSLQPSILDHLRTSLTGVAGSSAEARQTLELAEAIRLLAIRHGQPALEHCIHLVENLRRLLDQVTHEVDNPPGS
jgi:ActR/RegA family two-component response regulator